MESDSGIPSFLGITPFGPYCKLCNESLSIQKGIANHGKEKHPKDNFKVSVVIRVVHQRLKFLRDLHADDLTPFLTEEKSKNATWFCPVCFSVFTKACNYNRHLEVRNKNSCLGGSGGKIP